MGSGKERGVRRQNNEGNSVNRGGLVKREAEVVVEKEEARSRVSTTERWRLERSEKTCNA